MMHCLPPAAGLGPYQGAGPYIMRAKLSELSDVGEGISLPPFASQASPQRRAPCPGRPLPLSLEAGTHLQSPMCVATECWLALTYGP